jgi:hypothetical protein
MNLSKTEPVKTSRRAVRAGGTYRGVRLQDTGGETRFTLEQIRRAVEAAVAKNADAIGRRK